MTFEFDSLPSADGEVIRHHSRSFSLAARLLPREIRSDVETLYAWCRWCDDAVDEAGSPEAAGKRLEVLRNDVIRIDAGVAPLHPASRWLEHVVRQYGIPLRLPLDLLRAMETDLHKPELQTIDDLLVYCYQAAGTVGLMMSHIMGATDPRALQKAKSMGMAMQLTNIARDVDEDWRSGRRYIPESWLKLSPRRESAPTNRQVRRAVRKILALADSLYEEGYQGLGYLPNGARIAIRLAGNVYQEIGWEIRRQDYRVMNTRVYVPATGKLLLVVKCVADELVFRSTRMVKQFLTSRRIMNLFDSGFLQGSSTMSHETRYLGYLGISLTFVMATTLFFLMGINPKQTVYSSLPWLYCGGSAIIAAVSGLMARRINRQLQL